MIEWTKDVEKQFGRMLQIVLNDPQLVSLHQKFGGEIFRRSSIFHELHRVLLNNQVSGDTCFEIGTWNGITAVVLSRFFNRVVSVDIVHNDIRHEIVDYLGIKNIEFIDIADNDEKADVAKRTDFDFAYMDGNHAEDTRSDWNLVKECGQVLFQECLPMQPPVWELVKSLPQDEVVYGGIGMALWRKK